MRYAARVDNNHAEIKKALREAGARVEDLARVGGGVADLLVNYPPWPLTRDLYLLEIKSGPKEPLTPAERLWHLSWPVKVVCSPLAALEAIGAIRLDRPVIDEIRKA